VGSAGFNGTEAGASITGTGSGETCSGSGDPRAPLRSLTFGPQLAKSIRKKKAAPCEAGGIVVLRVEV